MKKNSNKLYQGMLVLLMAEGVRKLWKLDVVHLEPSPRIGGAINHLHANSSRWPATQRTRSDRLFTYPQKRCKRIHDSLLVRLFDDWPNTENSGSYIGELVFLIIERVWNIVYVNEFTTTAVTELHPSGSVRVLAAFTFSLIQLLLR